MSFMPGELVRRAAAGVTSTVSSTVSTVASVASGKKRHDSAGGTRHSFYEANLISNAKEKYTMTVKCTPNKDASTTADLAVKSGFLMKRNEQGAWQKRFMCIVPHMYLYYFDSEVAEAPRGIIDLELYQHTEREEGAGIQLVAADDSLRSFHFNDDDEENLNEWATSLIRDRYHLVCEERNAYQQMQSLMTGAIDNASSAQKSSEKEREQLEKQLSDAENLYLEARRLLQTNLFELGISDEEMSQLTDVTKLGICLKNHIADMRSSYERKVEDLHEMMNSQQTEYGKMTEEFLKKMENEQLARKNLEALILKERKESEKKVKEAEAQIDNITLNFQMAVAAKTTSETKANTLNEQKKLLVKEVKQLRKRVDELSAANDELKSLNDRLLKAANALQFTVKSSNTTSPKTVPTVDPTSRDASVLSPTSFDGEVVSTNSVDEGVKSPSTNNQELEELLSFTDQLIAKSEQLNPHDGRGRSFDSNTTGNADEGSHTNRSPPSSNPVYRAMNMFRSNGSDTDLAEKTADRQHSDEKSRNNSIVGDDYYEERPSWEMPPMALRELGWLSEEQNKLMEKRYGDVNDGNSSHNSSNPSWTGVSPAAFKRTAQDEQHVEEHRRGSTLSMFTGLLGSSNADSNSSPHTSGRRSSLMAITSMFNKKEKGSALSVEEGSNTATNVSVPVTSTTTSKPAEDLFFSSPFTTPNEEEERLPTAMRLHCLRCNGSVEGPKFSTCKCSTPALTPDDLNSDRLLSLTGIFKGGLFKATGLYSSSHGSSSSNNQGVSHNSNEISL